MNNRKLLMLTLSILVIALWTCNGFAFEKGTHEYINQSIATMPIGGFSLDGYLRTVLGFKKGVEEPVLGNSEVLKGEERREVWRWLGYGGIQEDNPEEKWRLILSLARNDNHFHNPLEADWSRAGLNATISLPFKPYVWPVFGRSSLIWMQTKNQDPSNFFGGNWSWHDARNYFHQALTPTSKETQESLFANTFRALGQIMHLVQDASVPAHTRNEVHKLKHHYEPWLESIRKDNSDQFDAWLENPVGFDPAILNDTTGLVSRRGRS